MEECWLLLVTCRDESIPPCRRVSDTSRHRCGRPLLLHLVHLGFHKWLSTLDWIIVHSQALTSVEPGGPVEVAQVDRRML